ncbi:MAG: hypothetical protein JNL58_21325 [Planctomyces sp.]|nr:hypothetical protein [Planctomyces sp.]
MTILKSCSYRRVVAGIGDQHFCSHPLLHAEDNLVPASVCRMCSVSGDLQYLATARRNPNTNEDGDDCMFLRSQIVQDSAFWSCSHPGHQVNGPDDCRGCLDFCHQLTPGSNAIRTWAVGVTTAPRSVYTLSRMLQSLRTAGWNEAFIFAEPGSSNEGLSRDHRWCPRGIRLGAFANWYVSLTELFMLNPKADAFLLCQDDVVFCADTRTYLERELWSHRQSHLVSLYCPATLNQFTESGFHELGSHSKLCGALALVIPNSVARAILCDSLFFHHRRNGAMNGLASIDSVVGTWCERTSTPFLVHSPSLCQHIGTSSTMWGRLSASPRRTAVGFADEIGRVD